MTSCSNPKPVYTLDFTKAHTRYKNAEGKVVPGVTTILAVINKPHLVKWANNLGLEGIDSSKVTQQAADIGSIAHAKSECYVKGMELDESNLPPDMVDKADTAYIKFISWWDSEGFEMLHSELRMVSEEWQVGGTADIVALDREGKLVLVDLKTSKRIYPEHQYQTCAYARMFEQTHGQKIDKILIARIGKDESGDFEVQQVYGRETALGVFLAALELHRAIKKHDK